jgi:hypothetical protein
MQQLNLTTQAVTHQTYAVLSKLAGRVRTDDDADDAGSDARDRGAVSLEQVLWFVAAGVSVAVIAGILWAAIKDKADDPITPPAAP